MEVPDDAVGGVSLPNCPEPDTALGGVLYHPTVFFTYAVTALVCVVLVGVTSLKFNSVTVFSRKIKSPSISNTKWILFYAANAVRAMGRLSLHSAAISAVRYGWNTVEDSASTEDAVLLVITLALDGLAVYLLVLALHHQRVYRSGSQYASVPPSSAGTSVKHPLLPKARESRWTEVRKVLFSLPAALALVLLAYYVFLVLAAVGVSDDAVFYLLLSTYGLLHLPVVILTVLILTSHTFSDGPTASSRRWLTLATLLHLSMVLPPNVWASILPYECTLGFASVTDLLQWLYVVSLLLYFVFLRAEFKRNMEECIWTTVSQIQDTFDFRRF